MLVTMDTKQRCCALTRNVTMAVRSEKTRALEEALAKQLGELQSNVPDERLENAVKKAQ